MNIINLTPHAITVFGDATIGARTFQPSGQVARVSSTSVEVTNIDGIPVSSVRFGEVTGLPPAEDNTIYIVSGMVLDKITKDQSFGEKWYGGVYVAPGELVRDGAGNPIGCKGFRV